MENFIFAEWFDFIFTSIIGILLGITLFLKKIRAKRNFLTFFYLLVILCCGFIFPKLSFELQQDYLYKNPKADLLEFGDSIQLSFMYWWFVLFLMLAFHIFCLQSLKKKRKDSFNKKNNQDVLDSN